MRSVVYTPVARQQLEDWERSDAKIFKRIKSLVSEIASNPYGGSGGPEALKHGLEGKLSRRITPEHRLVYEVKEEAIHIISCRYHY